MSVNLFKSIRKSYFIGTLLTSIMSNVMIFGQPIQSITIYNNQIIAARSDHDNYINDYLSFNDSVEHLTVSERSKNTTKTTKRSKKMFYALENTASIGVESNADTDNARDNYFTVMLPNDINLSLYDVVLSYQLFGLEQAHQTTKSINNHVAYGGQVITRDENWKEVKEVIPHHQFKNGKNEIFFNRRVDLGYTYEIKSLKLELVKKRLDTIYLPDALINYNGILHIVGYVSSGTTKVEAMGEIIKVHDGIFEHTFKNVPENLKTLQLSYGNNLSRSTGYNVEYINDTTNVRHFESSENYEISSLTIDKSKVSLGALEMEISSEVILDKSDIKIEGLSFKEIRPLNSDVMNVTFGDYRAYRTTIINNEKKDLHKIHLKYDPSMIPDGYSDKDVRIFSFDRKKRDWIMLPVEHLNYDDNIIVSAYNGDTDYINGVIKVPEMPETASYTPTTISDMEYADPTSGIVSIAPPTPNYTGALSTQFPIKLPTGRNGVMPSLSVNYNSDSGNGWMGLGWDLQLPAITLDTRWGVPRFDTSKESEIYQLNGEMMVLKDNSGSYTNPHRSLLTLSRQSSREFYLRKEGSYQKIVRSGNSPTTYKWTVTDKLGNRSEYGFNDDYVVKDDAGNISHWALYRTYDRNDNYVQYYYDKGIASINGANAQYFYPSSIKYTLHDFENTPKYYEIQFIRNEGLDEDRNDIITSARTGTLMTTQDLLTNILVRYYNGSEWQDIRSYEMRYEESQFNKQQLVEISEYDTNGDLFYSNLMEYYQDTTRGEIVNSDEHENWIGTEQNNIFLLLGGLPYIAEGSALGTGTTSGFSVAFRGGVGIGFNSSTVTSTAGGSYNYSQSTEKTKINLIDINGDGLSDKVFKENGSLSYLPNLGLGNGFGEAVGINTISEVNKTKSKTNTSGFDANIGLGAADLTVGTGKSWSTTVTRTDGFFADFNGDGLVDVSSGSIVNFNTTTPWNDDNYPEVNFNTNSNFSSNVIIPGTLDENIVNSLGLETLEEIHHNHPQFDHVKAWRAPYTGTININGLATLIESNICDDDYNNTFRLTIERATANQITGSTTRISDVGVNEWVLSPTNLNENIDPQSIQINQGDELFFRIHNTQYGCGGEVEWNPEITYTQTNENIPNTEDENGKDYKTFTSDQDYIMNNGGTWNPKPEDGYVQFDEYYNLNTTYLDNLDLSDNVDFVLEKIIFTHSLNENPGPGEPVYGEILPDQTQTQTRIVTYDVEANTFVFDGLPPSSLYSMTNQFINGAGDKSYVYRFYAKSSSNVQWDKLIWKPTITSQPDGTVHYPGVSYETFDLNINQNQYEFNSNLTTSPILTLDPDVQNDEHTEMFTISHNAFTANYQSLNSLDITFPVTVDWVVKKKINSVTESIYKKRFKVDRSCAGSICQYIFLDEEDDPIDMTDPSVSDYFEYFITKEEAQDIIDNSGQLYSQFFISDALFGGSSNQITTTLDLHPDRIPEYSFSSETLTRPIFASENGFYGTTYRGWGQFLYNGGIRYFVSPEGVIDTNTIVGDYQGNIDMSAFDHPENYEDIENNDSEPSASEATRYALYTVNNPGERFFNNAIISTIDESAEDISDSRIPASYQFNDGVLTSKLGRFGEPDILELHVSEEELGIGTSQPPNIFIGMEQYSLSKGSATHGNVNVGPAGGSGTSSEAYSDRLNQYIDLNGDRYPDIITKGFIQYTTNKGGLSSGASDVKPNGFISGANSSDQTLGVTITGVMPNSTASDNNKNTRTNINSGINDGEGLTSGARQWVDMNGDGLPDQVLIAHDGVYVNLNLGYTFALPVIWNLDLPLNNLITSARQNIGGGVGAVQGLESSGNSSSSVAGGTGVSQSEALIGASLIDINGDGLPDLVNVVGANYVYYLNNGDSFDPAHEILFDETIDHDRSITGNIYGSYTYGHVFKIVLPFVIIPIKVNATVTASYNGGLNEKLKTIQDIDGDGLPDILEPGNDNGDIVAHLNTFGKTHKLKTVHLPLGGSWSVDYKREGNTYDLPQNKWVLSEITTQDGFAGDSSFAQNETFTAISYENPKHDRREREFLGFGTVKVEQRNPESTEETFRYTQTEYLNTNIYLKGLSKRVSSFDGDDNILSENTTLFNILNPDTPQVNILDDDLGFQVQTGISDIHFDKSRLFIAPVKTVSTTYEGDESLSIEQQFLSFDSYGNLLEYKNLGDTYTGYSSDDAYRVQMSYLDENVIAGFNNTVGYVSQIAVFANNDNTLMRKRNAEYDIRGNLEKVTTFLTEANTSTTTMDYDVFGNMNMYMTESDFVTNITYDADVHTYPTSLVNSYNETSTTDYNMLFGLPVLTTDINNQQMRTRIDDRGRILEVTAPDQIVSDGWTIRMFYEGENQALPHFYDTGYIVDAKGSFQATNETENDSEHYAMTRHNVQDAQGGQLLTISIVDGLGSAIQLKKTLYAEDAPKWLISGKEYKDNYGRTVDARLTTVDSNYPMSSLYSMSLSHFEYDASINSTSTTMQYDVRDRMMSVSQPGETNSATTEYNITDGMFLTLQTNEKGQKMASYTDNRGRLRKTVQNDNLTTQFYYNVVGEKTKVRNHQGYETFYKYDLAGRRIEERHPDRGVQLFFYDNGNNLLKRQTSNLLAEEQVISYDYDYHRLTTIQYPQNPENNVIYTYGSVDNPDAVAQNAVGRIYMQEDASGVQGFSYDELGNIRRHLRGIAVAGRHTYWFHTQWNYDSFNRVHEIIYPDGETAEYKYNLGGELKRIKLSVGNGEELDETIVKNIIYDNYGDRQQIIYGNGTSTSYTYDARRRMDNLKHQFNDEFIISNKYIYDPLSNITGIQTNSPSNALPEAGQLGGPIAHEYEYDDYNRLVVANGTYTGLNDFESNLLSQEYTLNMEYDFAHNITKKTQTHIQGAVSNFGETIEAPQSVVKTNYSLSYDGYATGVNISQTEDGEFGYVQPHAPREIIETPDNDGEYEPNDPDYKKKKITYDANGNQISITQIVNANEEDSPAYEGVVEQKEMMLSKNLWDEENRLRAVDLNPEESKIHPLAVYTYDASGQRVVRYIPGRLDVNSNEKWVSNNERDEVMMYPSALVTSKAISKLGSSPEDDDAVSKYTNHFYIGSERVHSSLGRVKDLGLYPLELHNDQTIFSGIRQKANDQVVVASEGLVNTYTELEQSINLPPPGQEDWYRNNYDSKYLGYWYHSDHLGSSSYISNMDGEVSQHIEYLPFGETLVDEHQNSYNTPFKFNGKELDDETGNYYYGARYYNPKFSVWMSVDPLVEKTLDSYGYVYRNPARLIDPDGRLPTQWVDGDGEVVHDDGIDNGTVYMANDGYEHNGNIEDLTKNSQLVTKDFKVVGSEALVERYVISQFFKAEDHLDESFFTGGINVFSSSSRQSMSVSGMKVYSMKEGGGIIVKRANNPKPAFTIAFNRNKKNDQLSNVYNTRSTIEHESDHYWGDLENYILGGQENFFESKEYYKFLNETKAINYQESTLNYKKTTKQHKSNTKWYRNHVKN